MPISIVAASPLLLTGTWTLHRRMHDRRTGRYGTAVGFLTITPDGDWAESGRLRFGGFEGPFERQLRVRRMDHEWWLVFADGRPFHPWRPRAVVSHPCGDDLYCGLVAVDDDRMRTLWDVTGPAKAQRLLTTYARVAE